MSSSVRSTIPRTSNLLQDIKRLQSTLDTKLALYGDALTQNGLEWKAMGLPVDDHLLEAAKQWLCRLCIGLMEALDSECKKIGSNIKGVSELYDLAIGEELMASILSGLEFVSEASNCIGYIQVKTLYSCRTMGTIYGQWICENLSRLHDKVDEEGHTKRTYTICAKRTDMKYIQLLNNMTHIVSYLSVLGDLQLMQDEATFSVQDSQMSLESLSATLVEFTIRAIGAIRNEKSLKKVTGNVMMNPHATFACLIELLLGFTDKIIEIGGSEACFIRRTQTLYNYLENIDQPTRS
ncbi:hypothetical protein BY458DRAFT_528688 [Sporodiniella umbellata]|nr:hypothetical protein BY458DRAFT_528688 [Sporodiniella umbellata]